MSHSIKYKLKGYYWGMDEQQVRACSTVVVLNNGKQEYEVGDREDVEAVIRLLQKVAQNWTENR